jgi:hypothetical protein
MEKFLDDGNHEVGVSVRYDVQWESVVWEYISSV